MHGISVYNLCSAYDVDRVGSAHGVIQCECVCVARLVVAVYKVYALHSM